MAFFNKTWKQTKVFVREKIKVFQSDKIEPGSEQIDELPILVLQKIFSFLSVRERLNCKLVSKKWKFAAETAGFQSLCIYQDVFPYVKWCFTEHLITKDTAVYLNSEKFCNFNSRIETFRNLKKLCFFHVEMSEFFKDLHLLKSLKDLMIENYYKEKSKDQDPHITLNSSSLEKLSFKYSPSIFRSSDVAIESIDLNTPNLSSLIFWDEYFVGEMVNSPRTRLFAKFRFPLKVKHLECIEFDSEMSALKNLETLNCQKIVCPFALEDFRSLQRLELFPSKKNELEYIEKILRERKTLRREDLEITVCGFRDHLVAFRPEMRSYAASFDLSTHFLGQVAKHPDKLVGHIPWQFQLYKNSFVFFHRITKELSNDFFKKVSIVSIDVSDDSRKSKKRIPPSPTDVLQLLIQIKPRTLFIGYNFNPEFYRQLASIQSIRDLGVRDKFENLDYGHFLKLEYLQHLHIITEKLPLEFISKVFKMKFLKGLYFLHLHSDISIKVFRDREIYQLTIDVFGNKELNLEIDEGFRCVNELVKRVQRFKNENRSSFRGCLI